MTWSDPSGWVAVEPDWWLHRTTGCGVFIENGIYWLYPLGYVGRIGPFYSDTGVKAWWDSNQSYRNNWRYLAKECPYDVYGCDDVRLGNPATDERSLAAPQSVTLAGG